jgi:hypothetical protein
MVPVLLEFTGLSRCRNSGEGRQGGGGGGGGGGGVCEKNIELRALNLQAFYSGIVWI